MKEEPKITYGGEDFTGWQDFSFTSGLDKAASGFRFATTRSPLALIPPAVTSQEIKITSLGDLLLTGYVEKYDGEVDVEFGRSLTLSGRSTTSSIVDSDVTGHFRNTSGLKIIERVIADFGLEVETNITDWYVHPSFTVESGSKVKDVLFHVLRLQKATITVTPEGKLRVWQAKDRRSQGSVSTARFIKKASFGIDETKRFSEYTAKGQDTAFFDGVQASEIVASARDLTSRFRRKLIYPEPEATTANLREAAEKAARRSFGLARSLSLTLSTWRNEQGEFWKPGNSLFVDLPEYDLTSELIINDVVFSKSAENGTEAELNMKPLESLTANGGDKPTTVKTSTQTSRPGSGQGEAEPGVHSTTILGSSQV